MQTLPGPSRLEPRVIGGAALAAVIFFALVTGAVQVLRGDLDWLRAPLSFYLLGDYGGLVRVAYFGLGAALALLGAGYYRALAVPARSGAPLLLFVVAGLALGVTASTDSGPDTDRASLAALVHGLAASAAFLCVTVAMMLQAVRLRRDSEWRRRFGVAFPLAAVSFIAMWVHALWRDAPRGLTQKLVIVLILAWLVLMAWWLQRHRRDARHAVTAAVPTESLP